MPSCAVPGCGTRLVEGSSESVTLHQFPANNAQRKKWTKLVGRHANWAPTKFTKICEYHFPNDSYREDNPKFLKRDALPLIFPPKNMKKLKKCTRRCGIFKNVAYDPSRTKVPRLLRTRELYYYGLPNCKLPKPEEEEPKKPKKRTVPFDVMKEHAYTCYGENELLKTKPHPPQEVDGTNVMYIDVSTPSDSATVFLDSIPVQIHQLQLENQKLRADLRAANEKYYQLKLSHAKELKQYQKVENNKYEEICNLFFQPEQLRILKNNLLGIGGSSMRGRKWSQETLQSANELRNNVGTNGYFYLVKKGFPLPSIKSLSTHSLYKTERGYKLRNEAFEQVDYDLNPFKGPSKIQRGQEDVLCNALQDVIDEPDTDEEEEEHRDENERLNRVEDDSEQPETQEGEAPGEGEGDEEDEDDQDQVMEIPAFNPHPKLNQIKLCFAEEDDEDDF